MAFLASEKEDGSKLYFENVIPRYSADEFRSHFRMSRHTVSVSEISWIDINATSKKGIMAMIPVSNRQNENEQIGKNGSTISISLKVYF